MPLVRATSRLLLITTHVPGRPSNKLNLREYDDYEVSERGISQVCSPRYQPRGVRGLDRIVLRRGQKRAE